MTTLRDYLYDLIQESKELTLKDELDDSRTEELLDEYMGYVIAKLIG